MYWSGKYSLIPQTIALMLFKLFDVYIACPTGFELDKKLYERTMKQSQRSNLYEVTSRDLHYTLRSEGLSFAILDLGTTKLLKLIEETFPLRLEAIILSLSQYQSPPYKTASKSSTLKISLNLYTASGHAKAVGQILTNEKRFLQHPDDYGEEFEYDNPHYLKPLNKGLCMKDLVRRPKNVDETVTHISLEVCNILESLNSVDSGSDTSLLDQYGARLLR